MKQMFFSALLLLASLSVAAQNVKNDSINERFFNAKVHELTYRLNITDEQKKDFVAVYRRYNDEMRTVWDGTRMKKRDEALNKGNRKAKAANGEAPQKRTSADVAAAQKRKMERQQKAQNVQMKYLDEFAKVLDAKQMSKFYEVENKIQKKLIERRHKGDKDKVRKGDRKRLNRMERVPER